MDYVLAVDLGGTKIYSALVGPGDLIVRRDVRPTEAELGQERVLDNIMAGIGASIVERSRPLKAQRLGGVL